MIICKCVDELHRTNKERESDEEREAAKGIVEKLVSTTIILLIELIELRYSLRVS